MESQIKLEKIRKEHILAAIAEIDQNGVPKGLESRYYDLIFNGKIYPPKVVTAAAYKFATGVEIQTTQFQGGEETKAFSVLRENGFEIVKKTEPKIYDLLEQFIENAMLIDIDRNKASLKTKEYVGELYKDTEIKASFGQGNFSDVPWMGFLKYGQTIQNGIYPVILFIRGKKKNNLEVCFGVSETEIPKIKWNPSYLYNLKRSESGKFPISYVHESFTINSATDFQNESQNIISSLNQVIENFHLQFNAQKGMVFKDHQTKVGTIVTEALNDFKVEAPDWFKNVSFVKTYYEFFQNFLKVENLKNVSWPDIQKMGDHLHSANSLKLAKKRAFGNPNHEIEKYRKVFLHLVSGPKPIEQRLEDIFNDPEYKITGFGPSMWSEIIAHAFPDRFMFKNSRSDFAEEYLELKAAAESSSPLARFLDFNKRMEHLKKQYLDIVGKQTSMPVTYEIDQFFSWVYSTKNANEIETEVEQLELTDAVQYWSIAPGKGAKFWSDWQQRSIINIGWEELGDLSKYSSLGQLREKYIEIFNPTEEPSNNTKGLYEFAHVLKIGDYVFVKDGRSIVLGVGIVESDNFFISDVEHGNQRKVKWLKTGHWKLDQDAFSVKTLTNITKYPDFVKAIKSNMNWDVSDESVIEVPYTFEDLTLEVFAPESQLQEMLSALKTKKNIVLQGPPGVGKTFLASRLAYFLTGSETSKNIEFVQFHPSYSYEDFVQGYRPGGSNFVRKNGLFMNFCERAAASNKHHVLIIDEINRGNLSKIFGELLMLLESDKRGKKVALTYSENYEQFSVPENVFVIGTMNTADRSLSMMDYALRRRFSFFELSPEINAPKFSENLMRLGLTEDEIKILKNCVNRLNQYIVDEKRFLGHGFQVGHSFFSKKEPEATFKKWLGRILENEIIPLIKEYWFDDRTKAESIIKEVREAV